MENENNDWHDWEKNPHLYLTDSDGSFVLKKDGTPRKKGGRPQGATSNYQYTNEQKAKIAARRAVRNKQKAIAKVEKQLKSKRTSLKQTTKVLSQLEDELDGFQWYCDKCHSLLYEKYIPLTNIVSQLPPLFDIFWADEEARKCKECNAYLEKP